MTLMSWCMACCSVQRVTVPVLAVPVFMSCFGFTPATMGLLQSSILIGYLIGQLPSGWLADTRGGDRTMLVGMILWSLSCAALPLATLAADPLPWFMVARFMMGLSSAVVLPALVSAATKWMDDTHRTTALTRGYAGFHMGTVIGYALTPLLASLMGWKPVFFIYGVMGVITGVVGLRSLPPQPAKAEALVTQDMPDQLPNGGAAPAAASTAGQEDLVEKKKRKILLKRLSTLVQLGVLCWSHCAIGWGFFILQSWTPTFMASLGFQEKFMGVISGLPWLVCALVTLNTGSVADRLLQRGMKRHRVRRLMQSTATLGPVLFLVPLALPGISLPAAFKIACITGVLVLQAFSYAGFQAYVQDVAPQDSGKIISITNTCGILTGVVGNCATGFILEKTNDYRLVFLLTALIYLSAFFAWVTFMRGGRLKLSNITAH
mmetsp:Transcript_19000/g.52983  ORF Transcript_19000/g.52983 Transcript_19000/m.52983 type:complete len:434 (+) Transcript_19000:252-1553(+)